MLLLISCVGDPSKNPAESLPLESVVESTTDTASADPALALAAEISETELATTISALQDFQSRNIQSDTHDASRDYLVDRLEGYGLVVELDAFVEDGVDCNNIIARIPGKNPDKVWIFSAHYDSTSNQKTTSAPGADDNASGVAAVLEAARLLSTKQLEESVWLVLMDAEEEGSKGSAHMVEWLTLEGVEVGGVIAPDMIGYWPLLDGDAMDILGNPESAALVEAMGAVADQLGVAHKDWVDHWYCYGDDHTHFQEAGFAAIAPMDCVEAHNLQNSDEDTPHYHKTTDTLDTLYLPFTAKVTGVIVASLASWAGLK